MAGSATLNVKVLVDAAQAAAGLNQAVSGFESFAKKATAAFAGAFAVSKIVEGVKGVVTAASEMEQAVGGVDRIFKDSAQTVHDWASDTTDAFRVPAVEAERFATTMGNSLQQAGRSSAQAAAEVQTLGQVAADLSSAYGGDLVDALDAVNAAISKGEWERLESFGVTIKQSDITAEMNRIAGGADAITAANRGAIETQARINLLMKEAAPAFGAAAAESQTFQGRMDGLKEQLGALAVAAGGPLLDSFGTLIQRFTDLVPAISPIAGGLATVVSGIAGLPAPVLAVAAALVAFALAAGPIAGVLSTVGGAFVAFGANVRAYQLLLATAGVQMSTFRATITTAAAGVQQVFANMWAAIGGGAGLAVGAVLAAATFGIIKWMQAANDAREAAQSFKTAVQELQLVLRDGGNVAATAYDQFIKRLGELDTGFDEAALGGAQLQDFMKGLAGDTDAGGRALEGMQAELRRLQTEQNAVIANSARFSESGIGVGDPTLQKAIDGQQKIIDLYRERVGAVGAAQKAEDLRTKGLGEQTQAADKAVGAEERLKQGLEEARLAAESTVGATWLAELKTDAEDAARATDIFRAAMDKLQGRSTAYAQAQFDFGDSITDLGDELKKVAEDGTIAWDAIAQWDVGRLNREMPEVGKAVLDFRDNIASFTIAAFEASGGVTNLGASVPAAKNQMHEIDAQVRAMVASMGVAPDQIDAVVRSLGVLSDTEVEEIVAQLVLEDYEARKTLLFWSSIKFDPIKQQFTTDIPPAREIADKLNAEYGFPSLTPPTIEIPTEPKPKTKESFSDSSFGKFYGQPKPIEIPVVPKWSTTGQSIGDIAKTLLPGFGAGAGPTVEVKVTAPGLEPVKADIANLAGKPVTITVGANANAANTIISALMREQRTATITVNANAAQAQATISAVTGGAYQATVRLLGDSVGVNNTIRAVIGGSYQTTVRLLGDSVPVNNAIRAVIGGQYSTTVHINGDNSGAISAIRAITTGFYSATVHINADASGFYSVWNSLPTSRTITVTVNQVQGTVVAPPAAPGGLNAVAAAPELAMARSLAAAPTLTAAPKALRSTGATSTTNITIQAGIGDPDAIARAVKRVMLARDRRSGGVVAGEMRVRVGHS
jgi:hypothetical protein